MLNTFSLISICLNSTLYLSSFSFGKLPEAYAFFNNRRYYASHTSVLFSLILCLASCYKFLVRSLIIY